MTTLDADIHFMRPALHQKKLYAEANEIKRGANISLYSVSITDEKGAELVHATFTFASLHKPIEDMGPDNENR